MKKLIIAIILLNSLVIAFTSIKLTQSFSPLPTIIYDGKSKEFTYLNTLDTDLFSNFKDLMPGDYKEQEIILKGENIKNNTKVFLKSDNNQRDYYNISIYLDNKKLEDSTKYTQLSTFSKNGKVNLKVAVEVSKEAGNEIADLKDEVNWTLLVQEENNDLVEVPSTIDSSNYKGYIVLLIVSTICLSASIIFLLKTRKN